MVEVVATVVLLSDAEKKKETEQGMFKSATFASSYEFKTCLKSSNNAQCSSPLCYAGIAEVRGPKQNPGLEVQPHQCPAQGTITALILLAISDTGQDAFGLLGHLGTPGSCSAAVAQHLQVLSLGHLPAILFLACSTAWSCCDQMQDPAFVLVEPHTTGFGPSIRPVQIPLQTPPALPQINTPTQLGVTCKVTEGTLNPLI
ncbi:hypothetical protein DUI87_17946 [Hirundo rustica rustica]|uniref:Uncharacterized protein n=1 Tax=Hirundo rustica rustica TaxID=333673 RepID=A0A3M0K073_HIRRU|nr:hypothetical protein DUI87_17946 [Hirundo rustica rustica]